MNAPRSLALLLVFAVAVGGIAAQSPAAPPEATGATAAEEVYVPERAPAAGAVAPAIPAPVAASSAVAPAAPAPGDKKLATPAAKGSGGVPPPLSPRFQQVRDRIDALLGHRSETPPAFDPRKNPFRPAGAAPVEPTAVARSGAAATAPPPPVTTGTDYQLLQAAAATLKVSGTIQLGGIGHLIINQSPYKEGDVLNARLKGQIVPIRVKHISRYSYTLSLNDAELSVKY